jgi:hypothetical protein
MSGKSTDKHLDNAVKLPQAIDDHFNLYDTDAVAGWYTLDVLGNDKGGNAKSIVAVDGLPAGSYQINDDGTLSVHVDNLDPGTIATLNFSYTIQLGNGALSTAEVGLKVASTESLLANGSFENPAAVPGASGWTVTNIPGWTNTGGAGIEIWDSHGQTVYGGVAASDGAYLIETDSFGNVQDALTTTEDAASGVTYRLTFDYASRTATAGAGNTTDSFEIWWNGAKVGEFDPNSSTQWQHAAIDFQGADGTDTLQIREAGANDGLGALVDNVSLVIHGSEWVV